MTNKKLSIGDIVLLKNDPYSNFKNKEYCLIFDRHKKFENWFIAYNFFYKKKEYISSIHVDRTL